MLTAKVGKKDKVFLVQLVGQVDDQADFEKTIGVLPNPPFELHVNCGQVNRINSVGVKAWIKYFQGVAAKRIPMVFWDCAPPLVQQMNSVFNFLCGGNVMSVQVAFSCDSCDHNFVMTMNVGALKKANFDLGNQKCPKCGQAASFDDLPKVYFKFLMAPPPIR